MELVDNVLNTDIYNTLRKSVRWSEFSDSQAQMALDNDYLNVVAFSETKPIAMGRIIGDGIYFLLVDVVVMPNYQGKGIGKSIIERIVHFVKNKMSVNERCSIQLVSAQGKEEFYEKLGFSIIPNSNSGHGMQLNLRL